MREFDVEAFAAALDERRVARGLSWAALANEIWGQSALLNARRRDHPISPSTLKAIASRQNTSCQHALFVLRWLDFPPEAFVAARGPVSSFRRRGPIAVSVGTSGGSPTRSTLADASAA